MIPFRKMHGLGNDFVVFDGRTRRLDLSPASARRLAERRTGVGADTIVILDPPLQAGSDVSVRFINADGTPVSTCGNASRCVAALLFEESGRTELWIDTAAGTLRAWKAGQGITVDMGQPRLDWREIPVARPCDTVRLPLETPFGEPAGVSMGNPHAVFFVPDAETIDPAKVGPTIECDPLFPERTNVEFATLVAPDLIRMRVWERGVGITQACGSGACATLVAAVRRGLCGRRATIRLDGGDLTIAWGSDDRVLMTGPATTAFLGEIDDHMFAASRAAAA